MTESKKPAAAADGTGGAMSSLEKPAAFAPPEGSKFLTPADWSVVMGHVDPTVEKTTKNPAGAVNAELCKAWIFAATKVHAGWGTRVADDVLLSREQYEKAVNDAMNRPLSEPSTERLIARIDAAKPKEKV